MSFKISLLSIGPMSHVDFKKWPCRRVEFRGQGSQPWTDLPGVEISKSSVGSLKGLSGGDLNHVQMTSHPLVVNLVK